jgi:pimeloyl-ACP methyl ester carboxylesterase
MSLLKKIMAISSILFLSHALSACAQTTFDLPGAKSAYADIDDISMYYEIYGKGEPLLLLHGAACFISLFAYQLPELSNHFQVIAPESRGHGRTTDSVKPISNRLMSEDFIKLMDHLKIKTAYVVGWSDGGATGLVMAFDHPERVKKLVTIGANFDSTGLQDDTIEFFQNLTPDSFPFPFLHNRYNRIAPDPAHWLVFFEKIKKNMLASILTKDQVKQIQCPTLVMAGDHDVVKMHHTVDLFEALPKGQLIIVPNASHMVPWEKPEIVNQAIINFLSGEETKTENPFSKK